MTRPPRGRIHAKAAAICAFSASETPPCPGAARASARGPPLHAGAAAAGGNGSKGGTARAPNTERQWLQGHLGFRDEADLVVHRADILRA